MTLRKTVRARAGRPEGDPDALPAAVAAAALRALNARAAAIVGPVTAAVPEDPAQEGAKARRA